MRQPVSYRKNFPVVDMMNKEVRQPRKEQTDFPVEKMINKHASVGTALNGLTYRTATAWHFQP